MCILSIISPHTLAFCAGRGITGINRPLRFAAAGKRKEGNSMREPIKLHDAGARMVAHRGLSGIERENTCAAFIAAGNRSYYGIETDIHRTADGKYIVIHDDDARRVAGVPVCIEETDFDTLRAIRMNDLDGNPRGDLMFPSLEEYIRICRQYGKTSVLEIKNHFEPEDIERVIAIIRALGWLEHTVFISFDLPNMICIREKLPEQPAQYLVCEFGEDLLDTLKAHRLDLDIHHKAITPENVAACHENGIEVNVWTVDTPEDAQRALACGVDYITSNILE